MKREGGGLNCRGAYPAVKERRDAVARRQHLQLIAEEGFHALQERGGLCNHNNQRIVQANMLPCAWVSCTCTHTRTLYVQILVRVHVLDVADTCTCTCTAT